jgi:imidazolonepropionase-like amidohydrolase
MTLRRAASLAACCALLLPALLSAAPPRVHALTGARVVVAPGRVLPKATVVLRDGVIAAVGAQVSAPADARIWDLEGKTLYPGLIELYLPVAWPVGKAEELPPAAHGNPLVRPERTVVDQLRDAKLRQGLRAAGFTTALAVPGDGIWRGRGALLNLGDDLRASLLRPDAVMAASLAPNPGFGSGYPSSVMGAMALFRQTILDARWHRQAHAAYRASPAQARPRFDASLAALEPAAHGESTIVLETDNLGETLRAARVVEELGLRAWLVGSGEEYQRLGELGARRPSLLLPIAFPEAPKVGESDDRTVSLEKLRHWDEAPANPKRLDDAKVTFALTAHRQKDPKGIWKALARAVERGYPAERALAALTQVPAELLGLSGRMGTIEAGKIANLVVVDGDLVVSEPKIESVWIDGDRYDTAAESGKSDGPKGGR